MNPESNVSTGRIVIAGLTAGFFSNALLGLLFSSPPAQAVLYHPTWQSARFLEVTSHRNIPVSVAGLVVLSIPVAWLFTRLQAALPGRTWQKRGAFFGLAIWLMYWLPQEWFIYHTLLAEPLVLCGFELLLLLAGSLLQGVILAALLRPKTGP